MIQLLIRTSLYSSKQERKLCSISVEKCSIVSKIPPFQIIHSKLIWNSHLFTLVLSLLIIMFYRWGEWEMNKEDYSIGIVNEIDTRSKRGHNQAKSYIPQPFLPHSLIKKKVNDDSYWVQFQWLAYSLLNKFIRTRINSPPMSTMFKLNLSKIDRSNLPCVLVR